MDLRILGPFEVLVDGREVTPRQAKPRSLLAMLAVHANQPVAVDVLVEGLWSGRPPPTARTALQGYVSSLRKLLGADRIVTRPPGYALRLEPGELDVGRFEELVAGARAIEDAVERSQGLSAALALWRGEALADFRYDEFAQTEIARLEELRLATVEERLDAELALGHHAELLPELERLVAVHPLRERLRAQLMLALYRAGSQGEALHVFQRGRRLLAEELGIDPGPALQLLERQILAQDPALELSRPVTVVARQELRATERLRPHRATVVCSSCGVDVSKSARFCPVCGARVEPDRPSEERKLATVLFADLVGSTALADSQDPERTRATLDVFYDAMADEVERAGGTIEKFVGDAVMAAFGAPSALEDHAERALHAALAMQRRLAEVFGPQFELRIGVNTGDVFVGRPREGSSFVTGDAVNVAARLEQAAEPGRILAGERTVAAARGAFEFNEPTAVEAKGKPQGIVARRLVRALSLMRPRGVGGLAPAFVGREQELERLCRAYQAAVEERRPRLVTILGDAGVGKTRLVRELWQRLSEQKPEPLRRTGRCLSYGAGITYWALGEVLKEHLGLLESDQPELALARLGGREILGLALGLDVARDLHPLAARDRFQDAWAEFLTEVVVERPAVVLVEDVHWADDQLLDLLENLLGEVQGPLVLIATARPELLERRPGWSVRAGGELVELEPLSPQESVRMVDELLSGGLPAQLGELIVERAEGNPFFVEELLGVLIDRGFLARRNGGWALNELSEEFTVPDSIHAVLAARIDLLGTAEKSAMQAAAVIGRVFWAGPVYELVEAEPDLRVLEERDFVRRRAGSSMAGEREYVIKHALTREVAYASLPKARRARMHAAFAAWLERIGDGRDDHASFLAHHYAEAVRPEDSDLVWTGEEGEFERVRGKALFWLERAAELALGRCEIEDALALLHRALTLKSGGGTQARIWRAVGKANALKFDGEAFRTAMQNSLEVCSNKATCADTYSELAFQASIRFGMWSQRPDQELVNGWIDQALELSEPDSVSRARALIARCFWERDSAPAAREAVELAERLGDVELRSRAWGGGGVVAFAEGDYEAALAWSQRRLDVIDEISDPDHVADIYENAIPACCAVARFAEARSMAAEHDAVVKTLSDHHRVHGVSVLLEVEEACGGWERIRELAERTETAVEANLSTPCVRNARSLLVTALAAAYAGDEDRARRYERRADEVATEGYDFVLAGPRAWLTLQRGQVDEVRALIEPLAFAARRTAWYALPSAAARLDALAALKERSLVEREASTLLRPGTYLEPFAARALGVVREDDGLIEQAAGRFAAIGLEWHADRTRKLVA